MAICVCVLGLNRVKVYISNYIYVNLNLTSLIKQVKPFNLNPLISY
jgi:hypothetical protein